MSTDDERVDLIVIGCGVAGAAAAMSAAERAGELGIDLRIVVLERSPAADRGGNSRWTAAYLRMSDVDTPAPGFVEDLVNNGAGHVSRDYAERLATQAGPTLRWLESHGVEFGELPTIFLTQARPRLLPVGGGRVVIDTLLATAARKGVDVVYESTATALGLDDAGSVRTLTIVDASGETMEAPVGAVIIASGGFEGDNALMMRHVGAFPRTVAPGGGFNRGEGIEMALAAGARASGQWDLFHAEPVDPRSNREEAVVMIYPYALLVGTDGRRFLDEGRATIDEQYEAMARAVLARPDHTAWIVADQQVLDIPRFDDIVQTTVAPLQADTIAELAVLMGVPVEALVDTVERYNAATGSGAFDPMRTDGLGTEGLDPPKSNWARPLDVPPFLAWPQECSNVFTFGGLDTDLDARVVRDDGAPIGGLYAAGEVTGLYHGKYTGATSVLRGLVFGRIAGRHAVDHLAATRPATPNP